MICLFTDYGLEGPYLGQVQTVLHSLAPEETIINLMADAPRNNPKASTYLLASLVDQIPEQSVVFCVVDPGVGTGADKPVALKIDNRWYVGPDNGLFDRVARRGQLEEAINVTWQPAQLSLSFHGRDLYAPVCAKIAKGDLEFGNKFTWKDSHGWPDDLHEIIYIDHFGNCMTGIRAGSLSTDRVIDLADESIRYAQSFGHVKPGQAFWYENSNGLVEIAVNQGSATAMFGLSISGEVVIDNKPVN